jgi:hypothetical protein
MKNWKEEQRELTARSKMGRTWDRTKIKPGMVLTGTGSATYTVQPDGSFRRGHASAPLSEKQQ